MLHDCTFSPAVLMPMGIGLSRTSEKGGSRKEHPKVDGKEDGEGGREEADEHRTITGDDEKERRMYKRSASPT